MFKFTLTIATAVLLFASSADHGCASSTPDKDDLARDSRNTSATISFEKFVDLPPDGQDLIVHQAAFTQCMNNIKPRNLMLVCKKWNVTIEDLMQVNKSCWKAWYGIIGHEDIYETFLNGVLIYQPNPNSDEGMITLKISELANPLEGPFDLSKCGDAGKYLVISTGYRKGINPANAGKTEIWIAPRFLIEKKIATAPHYSIIMKDWDENVAPVGVFFTRSDDPNKYYEECTSKDLNFISENNLFTIWRAGSVGLGGGWARLWGGGLSAGEWVSFSFLNQNISY